MNFLIGLLSRPFLLVVLVLIFFLGSIFLSKKNKVVSTVAVLLMWFAIANVFSSNALASRLINKYGVMGTGVVVNQEKTNNLYNEEPVIRYNILLKTAEGQTVETYFETWDFNLYPNPEKKYAYPTEGVQFDVKYMTKNPAQFIILTNTQSPFVTGMNCEDLLEKAKKQTKEKFNFAPENPAFKNDYIAALQSYLNSSCETDEALLEELKSEIDRLKEGNNVQ